MKIQKLVLKILMLLEFTIISNGVSAQSELKVFQDWATTSGTQNFFYKNIIKTDANGNVFVAGATVNDSNNYDILVAKYNSRGILQWMQQYDGAGNGDDVAAGLYIDGSGNVYITGTTTTLTNDVDAVTIKYNSAGTQQWLTTHNGTGGLFDAGADVITDSSSNVYITGTSYNANANTDVITIKYNSSGVQQWVCLYNFSSNLNDAGIKLSWNAGDLNVGMLVQSTNTSYLYGVLAYNTSGTLLISQFSFLSISSGINQVNDIVKDASGNIYIAGALPVTGQGYNYDIIKLNSSLGLAWQRTYSGADNLDDVATGLKVDGSGNVYVTGTSATSTKGKNIVTLKYNSSGTLQWSRTYNDTLDKNDEAAAMAMDATGNIYIIGSCATEADSTNYLTMKYDASGNLLWTILSDGVAHLDDMANNIAIDNNGDIIVTGESRTAAGSFEYLTIKYVEKQIITPTDYNSETPASSFSYYTNKGQLINTNDSLIPEIKYYTTNISPAYYFKDNSCSFVFAHVDAIDSTSDTLHRIDLSFEKANSTAKTYPMEETRDYLNYFLPQCPDGITKVHGNKRLVTTGLYSNIDLMYSSNQNGIKMYFIIKSGGSPTNLQLLFAGASSFNIDGTTNALTINSSVGNITFDRPTAYQLTSSNTIVPITGWQCAWQTNGSDSAYKFYTDAYDNTKTLVIQVDEGNTTQQLTQNGNLEWSTYFGGSSHDWCKDVETNSANDVWVLGETFNPDFPLSPNIQTMTFVDNDCFVIKFNDLALPQWATYFGGNDWDGVSDMKLDSKENVYVIGSTASTDFPNYTSDGINYPMHGTQDGYLIVFKNTGNWINCDSYIGGNSWDYPYSIDILDNSGESNKIIVIGGITYSGSGFPTHDTTNTYYQNDDFESRNAFIMRLDYTYANVWCSLFGGLGDEAFTDVTINYNGDRLVACGWTTTSDYSTDICDVPSDGGFPICTPTNAYTQSFGGGDLDLMIAEFDNSNQLVWSTYFGGNTDDMGTVEGKLNPRICFVGNDLYLGTTVPTNISSTFPLHTSTFSSAYNQSLANTSNDHNFNVIISRFNNNREQTWCTAFGGGSVGLTMAGMGLDDICAGPDNTIYVTGYADADYVQTSNLCSVPTTAGEFPICNYSGGNYLEIDPGTTNIDEHRQFIATFNSNDNLIWSTRFGWTSHLSEGYGIATSSDKLFVVGHCKLQTSQEYTLWELDQSHVDPLDYFQSNDYSNSSGTISRFDISEITSSIDKIEFESTMILSPNPASDYIEIRLKNTAAEFEKIFIYDALGSLIAFKEIINKEQIIQINISALPQGFYLLHITDNSGIVYSGKFIKL